MIEICNTLTINFGYQTRFFSQITFKLHLARNVFDCLLWVYGPGVMIVNIGARDAPVNIAFSSSRNAALIERKMLQYITLSIKWQLYTHYTLNEIKTQVFTMSDVLACVSVHCADQRQDSIPDFLAKSIDITQQTFVDAANEYLQAYNTGADVKSCLFCSLHKCK